MKHDRPAATPSFFGRELESRCKMRMWSAGWDPPHTPQHCMLRIRPCRCCLSWSHHPNQSTSCTGEFHLARTRCEGRCGNHGFHPRNVCHFAGSLSASYCEALCRILLLGLKIKVCTGCWMACFICSMSSCMARMADARAFGLAALIVGVPAIPVLVCQLRQLPIEAARADSAHQDCPTLAGV